MRDNELIRRLREAGVKNVNSCGLKPQLVIQSSSVHCVDDMVVQTAVNILNERADGNMVQPLVGLNGLMLMSSEYNISVRRSVYLFELLHVRRVLPPGVREALARIRTWHA